MCVSRRGAHCHATNLTDSMDTATFSKANTHHHCQDATPSPSPTPSPRHEQRRQGSVGRIGIGIGFVGWLCTVTLALVLVTLPLAVEAKVDGQDEFVFPNPLDYNITWEQALNASTGVNETSGGWNIWQPQIYVDGSYGDDNDNDEPVYVMISSGCKNPDGPGKGFKDDFYQHHVGFTKTCLQKGLKCQCRPDYDIEFWNVPLQIPDWYNETFGDPAHTYDDGRDVIADPTHPDYVYTYDPNPIISHLIFQGIHKCSWYIRRVLYEHRMGLLNVGGITTHCPFGYGDDLVFDEARQVGVPILVFEQAPPSDIDINPIPQPDGYVGTDYAHLGRSMANLLKQLRPDGGQYAIIMQWVRDHMHIIRDAFNDRIAASQEGDETGLWKEIDRYPYSEHIENPMNVSCPLLECAFGGIQENTTATAIIIFYERPLRLSWYREWRTNFTRDYPDRNLTIIAAAGREYLELLDEGYIDGMISKISFDDGRRSVEVLVDIHTKLRSGELTPTTIPIEFYDTALISNNVVPIDLDKLHPPQLERNLLQGLKYIGYVALGIVLMTSLVCIIWTFKYRNNMVVKASQPIFLLLLVYGIIILSSTIIPLSYDAIESNDEIDDVWAVAVCMSQPWLAFTGFTVIFAALFSKAWRVNKLFNMKQSHQRITVRWKDVIGPFAIVFSSNVIILACWTIIDPLKYIRLVGDGTDLWNRDIESYGVCRSNSALAFLLPLGALNFAVLGIACWQAFEGRNIESAFSESKYIGLTVGSLFQAFLTSLPILVTVKEEPRSFYLVLTLTIFVLCEGILLLIFLPKAKMVYTFSQMSESEQYQEMSANVHRSASNKRFSVFRVVGDTDSTQNQCAERRREMPPNVHHSASNKSSSAFTSGGDSAQYQLKQQNLYQNENTHKPDPPADNRRVSQTRSSDSDTKPTFDMAAPIPVQPDVLSVRDACVESCKETGEEESKTEEKAEATVTGNWPSTATVEA